MLTDVRFLPSRDEPLRAARWLAASLCTLTIVLTASHALASPDDPIEQAPRPGFRTHDGFYFRASLGPAFVATAFRTPTSSVSTASASGELAFGGTPSPGLVIGGAIWWTAAPSTTATQGSIALPLDALVLYGVGPFIDWYPDPRGGLHFESGLAMTQLMRWAPSMGVPTGAISTTVATTAGGSDAGYGALVGGGYQWFVSDQWSVGVLGRVLGASGPKMSALVPALVLEATYH